MRVLQIQPSLSVPPPFGIHLSAFLDTEEVDGVP